MDADEPDAPTTRQLQARNTALLLQGVLAAEAMKMCSPKYGLLNPPARVEMPTDYRGIYHQHFRVHLASGAVLRVTVEPEDDVDAVEDATGAAE